MGRRKRFYPNGPGEFLRPRKADPMTDMTKAEMEEWLEGMTDSELQELRKRIAASVDAKGDDHGD